MKLTALDTDEFSLENEEGSGGEGETEGNQGDTQVICISYAAALTVFILNYSMIVPCYFCRMAGRPLKK